MIPKMSLAPVFYTLAQVQFNPIAKMSDYVAALQENLRRSGFPDFRQETQFGLTIRRLDESQPDIQSQPQARWSFTNVERTEGYLLFANALVFHTTAYNTFENFLQKTLSGLELVHQIVTLAYVERIGLRYLDAIVPKEGEELLQYLNPSLLGLSITLNEDLRHSFTETVTEFQNSTLVARALTTKGVLGLSPDLFPLQLQLKQSFTEINGLHTVLDTDCFFVNRSSFDIANIKTQLKNTHDNITKAFEMSVTEYAKEVELSSPADLLANIRDVFGLSMSDLAALLGVTRPTAYAWLEGQEPKPEAVMRIRRLSRTADETKSMNISRLDKLIHRPIIEGRSLFDVLKADEDPTQILSSVREIAEKEAQTRSNPKGSGKHLRSLDDVLGESSVAIDMQS
jgi:uncharacterized protein (TIGR04255 family)